MLHKIVPSHSDFQQRDMRELTAERRTEVRQVHTIILISATLIYLLTYLMIDSFVQTLAYQFILLMFNFFFFHFSILFLTLLNVQIFNELLLN